MKKKKSGNRKVWNVFARYYVRHYGEQAGENDIARAFKAGMCHTQNKQFRLCKNSAPVAFPNQQILVIEYFEGHYDSTFIYASEYGRFVAEHPFAVAWTTPEALFSHKSIKQFDVAQ